MQHLRGRKTSLGSPLHISMLVNWTCSEMRTSTLPSAFLKLACGLNFTFGRALITPQRSSLLKRSSVSTFGILELQLSNGLLGSLSE